MISSGQEFMDFEKEIKKADSLINENKPIEAVLFLKEIVKRFPNYSYAYYLLGVARIKCGLFNLAKRTFEAADKLEPNNAEYLKNLGWAKVMINELEGGRNDLRRAINLDLTNPLIYLDLAMSYFYALDFEKTFEWLGRARALDPKNEFVLANYEFAKNMEKDFCNLSKKDQEKMKREKMDDEMRKREQLFVIKGRFSEREIGPGEMEELKSEIEVGGFKKEALLYKDDAGRMSKETKEQIMQTRKEIEQDIIEMLKETESDFSLDDVKEAIYNEEDTDDMMHVVAMFDRGGDASELGNVLELVNDAWNYFPHKTLNGLSPSEMILKNQNNKK